MSTPLTRQNLLRLLREDSPQQLSNLWKEADETRRAHVGDAVSLRGVVKFSNHCVRQCAYCGLRAGNRQLKRYRLTVEEILQCAQEAVDAGCEAILLKSGEDYGATREWLTEVIRRVKGETGLSVALSVGERPERDLKAWRAAGVDGYFLPFETSDRVLYDFVHPPRGSTPTDRMALLTRLKELGYEIGSGIIIGLPGQKYASIVDDLLKFQELKLDVIGVEPFIPHPATPLRPSHWGQLLTPPGQVPSTELIVHKVLALARLICPDADIRSATALEHVNKDNGRELCLARGANVAISDLTPKTYRDLYEVFPSDASLVQNRRTAGEKPTDIKICMGSSCYARGNNRNIKVILDFLAKRKSPGPVDLAGHLCEGHCQQGPNIIINGEKFHQVDPVNILGVLNRAFTKDAA